MYLIRRWRGALIALFLALTLLATEREAESYGDTLQVVLPLAGLGCSIVTGDWTEYLVRYSAAWITMHTAKRTLPEDLATRPGGGGEGFPSGHTTSAAFGASALVWSCLDNAPILKTSVVFMAAFTGASRIEAEAHDIWQVLGGGLWGVLFERLLRRPGPLRTRVTNALGRLRLRRRPG